MAAQPFYSMKWENYYYHVSDLFHQLLDTGSMSDISLYAEGTRINCHKVLLSACSPYFQEILSDVGSKNTAIVISGIEGEDVKSCIEFIYKGEISVKADRLCSVLKAAEALKICGLTDVKCGMTPTNESDTTSIGPVVVNNQSEKDSSNKLVFTRQSPSSDNRSNKTADETSADSNNHKDMHGEDSSIVVYPDMLMLEESVDGGENCGSETENVKENDEANGNQVTVKLEIDDSEIVNCNDLKVQRILKRKDSRKKLYSEEAMQAALEDMKSGKNLVKSAEKHRVPKTTLYCRARAIGACSRIQRRGYPREKMIGALQAVAGGYSLQNASTEFGIPKTVLWRRVKKESGNRCTYSKPIKMQSISPHANTVAEDNVSIRRVSPQYQIPKATLFRWEKVAAVNNKEPQEHFISSGENVDVINAEEISKESGRELLAVESENDDEVIEIASSSNVDQDNTDLQVSYLENPEFSNSSIIILAPVDQHNDENKFTDLRGTLSAQIFVKDSDIESQGLPESQHEQKD